MKRHEKKKKEAMKKSADQENVVVLSLVIEASIEASFQVSVTKCTLMLALISSGPKTCLKHVM